MKSIINDEKKPAYPCLKQHETKGFIVLFTDFQTGTIVAMTTEDNETYYSVGSHSKSWDDKNSFVPFAGEVTLSN